MSAFPVPDQSPLEVEISPLDSGIAETFSLTESIAGTQRFFARVQRPCCPVAIPPYQIRHPLLQQIAGYHVAPDPLLPFWWTEGVLNSSDAKRLPWLRCLLQQVTWAEMMEGKVAERKFKQARDSWTHDARKQVSSPKIGNMLNILFIHEPTEVLNYNRRSRATQYLPVWWYTTALRSTGYSGLATGRFLAQTDLDEFNSGSFKAERLHNYCEKSGKRLPKSDGIDTFLRQIFSEFPQVITRYNQRGAKTALDMRIAIDPYSIVTMSSRSPHWTSCQNPVQDDTHEMSHRLWANLMDPNMALMEMIDPSISEDSNLVARAIVRIVQGQRHEMLYLDCLYGERGYISSFVSLCRSLSTQIDLQAVSGRMIPFYTGVSISLSGQPVDFHEYEVPYLDFGQWQKSGKLSSFHGEGHLILPPGEGVR
ncbi:MAG: hypothetical protein FWE76_03575 [Symbiobacteriaceae bacterium]|nr:hypothetical protein [Symbiobacteriaceae bacterium]